MRLVRDILVTFLITAAVMATLEIGLRASGKKFEAQLYTIEPGRGFSWRPKAEGWTILEGENYVRINSDGMRDKERPIQKPGHLIRIAVIGSSEVAAEQVPLEKTFEGILETHLNSALKGSGYQVDVLNFGVNAYNLTQDYLTLRDHVWKYAPDVVLFTATAPVLTRNSRALFVPFLNTTPFYEVQNGQAVPDKITRGLKPASSRGTKFRSALSSVVNQSEILLALDDMRNSFPRALQSFKADFKATPVRAPEPHALPPLEQVYDPNAPQLREPWKVTDALFARMAENCAQRKTELWLVMLSTGFSDNPNEAERIALQRKVGVSSLFSTDERMEDIARRRGIRVAALSKQLAKYAVINKVALHGFYNTAFNSGHYNALGNREIGRMISSVLLARSPEFQRLEKTRKNGNADERPEGER